MSGILSAKISSRVRGGVSSEHVSAEDIRVLSHGHIVNEVVNDEYCGLYYALMQDKYWVYVSIKKMKMHSCNRHLFIVFSIIWDLVSSNIFFWSHEIQVDKLLL